MRDMVVLLGAEVPSGRAIARKLRAEQYSCKLMTSNATAESVRALDAAGIVIAGELSEGAHAPDPALLSLGLPVLALGSSARLLMNTVGVQKEGEVAETVLPVFYQDSPLFVGVEAGERWVDRAGFYDVQPPYRVIADSDGVPLAVGDDDAHIYLVQFQIERNDPDGTAMLRTFAGSVCGCTPWWTTANIVEDAQKRIVDAVGDGEAVCAISGGLDSTVAALLARNAIGERARCVFVDTGLLREGEAEETEHYFSQEIGLNFVRVDASEKILASLSGLRHMPVKWRVIEREISGALREATGGDAPKTMIKGTNYVDVLSVNHEEVRETEGNVTIVEPLAELFKDEIRQMGEALGMSRTLLSRQPFPGMGLAARIRGEVTEECLRVLRRADAIFVDEMRTAGQEKRMDRYFAMLDEVDGRVAIILRALQGVEPSMNVARLPYDLLERTVERIGKELQGVERVLYDMTPGMAEWPL